MIDIVDARASHLRHIAAHMRQMDRDEIEAVTRGRMSPLRALMESYSRAKVCKVAVLDGRPLAIWGVGTLSVIGGVGSPWFLATDEAMDHKREIINGSMYWRDQLFRGYHSLENMVDCRNTVAIRWLKWMGFKFSDPFPIGDQMFMKFEMRAENVHRD